ncbi:RNA polymerase sigma factor [Alteromonas halophila]|uniref:RNA polymerase sigma factor n=1 Tax=Alteromonas halophila TaxID=516698 RepID=A0A918JJ88_9ALTE|nr:sigma-70 family RNA polymerase sigma factor [Alteromonas halophila]GGW81313.1 RNA polymerase sigma factor [Alteromonas halophila]
MFEVRDERLVKKALKGDKKAWLTLIDRYEKQIFHYAIRMTGNTHDAADLMQDIFLSVFRSLDNFRGDGAFKAWLFRIAHFRCMEFYRRKRPEQGLDDTPEQPCDKPCPEMHLHGSQQSSAVVTAMQALPLAQKAVVELKFFGQFTFEDIALQLGISPNTAKSRLYSALARLKLELE